MVKRKYQTSVAASVHLVSLLAGRSKEPNIADMPPEVEPDAEQERGTCIGGPTPYTAGCSKLEERDQLRRGTFWLELAVSRMALQQGRLCIDWPRLAEDLPVLHL